jgi:transposase-like protein
VNPTEHDLCNKAVGVSTLNKWVQQHQHKYLMSGPHEDVEKENTRLRKETPLRIVSAGTPDTYF